MKILMAASIALLVTTSTAFAAPALTNATKGTILSQAECQKAVVKAMEGAGFTNVSITGQSVFGFLRQYIGSARCIEEYSVIFFAVAGPDSNQTSKLIDRIKENLED